MRDQDKAEGFALVGDPPNPGTAKMVGPRHEVTDDTI